MRRAAVLVFSGVVALSAQQDFRAAREAMVRGQIEARGIRDEDVLRAMRGTPRHEFVPEEVRELAYTDQPLPIGHGQTISQPYIVAFMTDQLDVDRHHRVLEIGTGSGYQAAVLAALAEHVYTMEIVPELAASAARKLAGYENITVREGDGYAGWPEEAPFDRVMLTAAPPEIPRALIDQLAPGGKLLAPEGGSVWSQQLVLVEKDADGAVTRQPILGVRFVPMVRGEN